MNDWILWGFINMQTTSDIIYGTAHQYFNVDKWGWQ